MSEEKDDHSQRELREHMSSVDNRKLEVSFFWDNPSITSDVCINCGQLILSFCEKQ